MNRLLYYYVALYYIVSFLSPLRLKEKRGAMMLLLGAERQMLSRLSSLQLSIYYIASRSCRTCDGLFVVPEPAPPPRKLLLHCDSGHLIRPAPAGLLDAVPKNLGSAHIFRDLVLLLLGRPPCQLKNYVGYSYTHNTQQQATKSKRKGAVTFRHEE